MRTPMAGNLEWGKGDPIGPPPRPLWREPPRFVIGLGCFVILATAFLPWATGFTPVDGPVTFDGWSGAGDGVIIVMIAGVAALTALVRTVVDASSIPIRWVPAICGVALAFEFGTSVRTTGFAIEDWAASNGHGDRTIFFYLLGLGIGAVLVGAIGLVGRLILVKAFKRLRRRGW
ncbi:MAG: hypothetical protein ACYDAK_01520 [Candidatus Limnocylindrales bacterium]